MSVFWLNRLNCGIPMRHFVGKGRRAHFSRGLGSVIAVYLLLGFSFFGFCDDLPMLSVPLGFGISGFDLRRNWVSQNGIFAFGFFEGCLRDTDYDDGLVVGIRYNLGIKEANVPVWTVGGGIRVSVNSTFGLSADGRLVLCENPSSLIVWSSNTSNLGVQKASLLDNGNLVLFGVEDEILWQSFDSPTSTLLPGQSFRFPQSLRAPSTKSISSYYNFVIHCSGELALVWESNVTYWRSHWSSTANIKEARFDSSGVLGLFDCTNRSVWSVSSKDSEDPSIVVRHLRIDPDGNLRIYSWDSVLRLWKIGWQAVENQCDVFGSCGLYSLCGFNSTGPVCSCLYEESLSQWTSPLRMDAGVSGCKKLVDLANCKMRTGMMVLKHSVLYGLYPPHDVDIMLNEEDCRQYCLNETSCIAVTSKNDGSGLCTIKRTSFISGYGNPAVPAISFLKVCLVPQAVSAQKTNPHTLSSRRLIVHASSSDFVRALTLIGLTTALGCLVVQMSVFWIIYQRRKARLRKRIPFEKYGQMNRDYSVLIQLTFEEIKQLTTNFTSQLGPSIFKGILPNKTPIIAKVLNNVAVSEKDFRVAVSILGGTHHWNLVALKGFCYDQKHKILLYEYISAGSLDKWLFSEEHTHKHEGEFWQQRLNIALGVARALAYLHSECQNCVPHGNLKLENVMLNEMLVPKVMDFGLNNLISREATTSSESASDRDIYKFGEMLIQIVTCKKDTTDMKHHLVEDIREQQLESQEQERVVKIALWCMQNQPFLRPSIGEIVKVLEGTLPVDNPPSNFSFGVDNQIDGEDQKEIEVDFGVGS